MILTDTNFYLYVVLLYTCMGQIISLVARKDYDLEKEPEKFAFELVFFILLLIYGVVKYPFWFIFIVILINFFILKKLYHSKYKSTVRDFYKENNKTVELYLKIIGFFILIDFIILY